MNTQNDLREALIEKRKQLSRKLINQHAKALFEHILSADILHAGVKIGVYHAHQGEVDLSPVIEYCWAHKVNCYLPLLHPHKEGHLARVAPNCFIIILNNSRFYEKKEVCIIQHHHQVRIYCRLLPPAKCMKR